MKRTKHSVQAAPPASHPRHHPQAPCKPPGSTFTRDVHKGRAQGTCTRDVHKGRAQGTCTRDAHASCQHRSPPPLTFSQPPPPVSPLLLLAAHASAGLETTGWLASAGLASSLVLQEVQWRPCQTRWLASDGCWRRSRCQRQHQRLALAHSITGSCTTAVRRLPGGLHSA